MAITKQKKETMVADLTKAIADAQSLAFVQFNKLTVAQADELRVKLRSQGVGYKVIKKTLLGRVLGAAGYQGEMPSIEGNIALAYSADALAAAREVYEFGKTNKDNIKIVGGVFENKYMDAVAMNEIATIPGLQTLRGMFLNVINSPIQGLAVALGQIAEKRA